MFYVAILNLLIITLTTLLDKGHSVPVVRGENVCTFENVLTPVQCSSASTSQGVIKVEKRVNFPYMMFIEKKYVTYKSRKALYSRCGGIILRKDIVLTAAHCAAHKEKERIIKIRVLAGAKDIQNERRFGQVREVKGCKIHKHYEPSKFIGYKKYLEVNDLAILWLKTDLDYNETVQPADLADEFDIEGKFGTGIGWGTDEFGEHPSTLQKVELEVMNDKNCRPLMGNITAISDDVFCAISPDKKCGVSKGDSGGPFIANNKVYGLVSFGSMKKIIRDDGEEVSVCNPRLPQVFTNLVKYKTWIEETIEIGVPEKTCSERKKFCAM